MKTNTSCYLALTALATVLTPVAFAQAPDPGRAAAQNASAIASAAAARATPPVLPSAAATGQAAAQQSAAANSAAAQGAANAAAHSPSVTGATSTGASATNAAGAPIPATAGTANAGMAGSTEASVDASRNRVNAKTQTNAAGTASAPGLNGTMNGQVSASLNAPAMTTEIRNSSFETRDTVYSRVDASLQTTHVAMAQLRQRGSQLSGQAREQFKNAYEQLRIREQALRDSLRDARSASAATYADAQAKLASDYDAYAQAVAAAEAAGAVNPRTP